MPRGRKPKPVEPRVFNHSEDASIAQVDFKSEKWTVSKLVTALKKNTLDQNAEMQRGQCWNARQKSLFIHSIIMNYYVPPLIAAKRDGKNYDLLDGKQRASTLLAFTMNKFALKDIPPVAYDDDTEDDYNNLKFKDLPEDIQETITGYNLTVVTFNENTSREQTEDVFYRANNGTSLRASDKNFSKAICKDKITALVDHDIFEKALTETAQEKLAARPLVINSYILTLTDDLSLDSGDVTKFLKEYEISDQDMTDLDEIFSRLLNIAVDLEIQSENGDSLAGGKVYKRALSRTNLPLLAKFLKNNVDDDKNLRFFNYFFSGEKRGTINAEYNELLGGGVGKRANIQKRYEILENEYKKFK